MKRNDIILASGSPRRIEMFAREGFDVRVHPADIDEHLPMEMAPEAAVMYLALSKALDVARQERGLVIAADTVVVYEGEIIGKPADEAEAFLILSRLRRQTHQVITGVCLIDTAQAGDAAAEGGPQEEVGIGAATEALDAPKVPDMPAPGDAILPLEKHCFYDVTEVTFGTYTNEDLLAYVRTPEPYDKAGGYAIQETFGQYIDHIDGDLNNVIGFPMYRVKPYLQMKD